MTNEKFIELWREERLDEIEDNIDDSWRHGNNHYTIFELLDEEYKRTGVFYAASYQVSGDGEQHGIRDDDFDFSRVYKEERVVTETKTFWHDNPPVYISVIKNLDA